MIVAFTFTNTFILSNCIQGKVLAFFALRRPRGLGIACIVLFTNEFNNSFECPETNTL